MFIYHIYIYLRTGYPQITSFFFLFLFLIFRERRREGKREGEKHQCKIETSIGCVLYVSWLGAELTTQACALTRNRTGDLSLCGTTTNQLSHTSKGSNSIILFKVVYYTIDEEKINSQPGPLCEVHMFSPHLHGFSPGTPMSSHIPNIWTFGELACLHCPNLNECGCVCQCLLSWKGILSKVGSHLLSWAVGIGSATCDPKLE